VRFLAERRARKDKVKSELTPNRRQLESCSDIALQEIKGLIKDALGNFEGNNRGKGIVRHVVSVGCNSDIGRSLILARITSFSQVAWGAPTTS
jgi:hypothetical protein